MSEYKELVKDLNDLQELPPMECIEEYHNAHDRKLYGRAASELERLAFIREAWGGATEGYVRRAEAAEAEVEHWRNNFDNAQLQATDLSAEVEKLKVVLGDGVRMAAAMNMTAGWVDSAKQILGGKS